MEGTLHVARLLEQDDCRYAAKMLVTRNRRDFRWSVDTMREVHPVNPYRGQLTQHNVDDREYIPFLIVQASATAGQRGLQRHVKP